LDSALNNKELLWQGKWVLKIDALT
jgi:hypothetical protein